MDYRSTGIYKGFVGLLLKFGIKPEKMKEFMKFAVVGGSGVIVNMGFFFIFTRYAGVRMEFASPMAIEISILTNFFLNNAWTFRKRDTRVGFTGRILRYHLVTAVAGLVNYLTLLLLVKVFGMHDMIGNLIGILLGTVINFFLNSLWTWRVSDPLEN
ncbi:MAG TPA: GtrA family protein [Bacteroides sp.]|nr:GtrA family protein [Bacteroides sp.]